MPADTSNTTDLTKREARLRQTLLRVRSSLLGPINEGAITDTLWMDLPCPETVIDFIDSEMEAADGKA